jgi:hypothetical protein
MTADDYLRFLKEIEKRRLNWLTEDQRQGGSRFHYNLSRLRLG